MKKFWLIFTQSVTISLGIVFVIQIFHPDLLARREHIIEVKQAAAKQEINTAGSYRLAAQRAMPSVVNIFTSKEPAKTVDPRLNDPILRHFFGDPGDEPPQKENSLGSGVIVSAQGLILTNHHVVETADEIEVALADGRTLPAKVVGTDPETDLAVIKVDAKNLPAIIFGRSDQLGIGDVVLAIGNPFGVGQTVTQGIVSALGRNHLGINTFENFIQTDAPINPGNSGGALVDIEGHLIGVNSAIYSRSGGSMGIGFAIPVSLAQQVMEQIVRQGSVTRGWVGVEAQDVTPELAESFHLKDASGALIAGILRGGPADKAGVRPGDILLEINGKRIQDTSGMLTLISALKPNSSATLKVMRNGVEKSLTATIGRRPKPEAAQQN
ncbi:MAG TPA: Do family serine endopeptidase [Novimethylophilus sp.]|jgi:serine protease DegQ|uniref:Do family serine endopeptidase n=1 Tax=Novimethylophilus sp. TaxID=2137426 RepID=UPI002F40226F